MSTKSQQSAVAASSTNPTPKKRSTMSSKSTSAATVTAALPATSPAIDTGPIAPPPLDLDIPPVPDDYAPGQPGEFASIVPRQGELSALPQAVADLKKFAGYDQIMGSTAPSYDDLVQSFTVGAQWSSVRQALSRFNAYAGLQEGLAWKMIRSQMESLVPAFTLAAKRNPSLIEKYPGLTKLLGMRQTIAMKGASTRVANDKARAAGQIPSHGKVGKQRLRKAEKAALASTTAAAPLVASTTPSSAQVAAPAAGVTTATATAPVAAPVGSVVAHS